MLNNGWFSSSDVTVFPSAYRTETSGGKYTSEQNFVNILNSILDYDSYVIGENNGYLEVVIHGYYFKINISQSSLQSTFYLAIRVEKSNNLVNNNSLVAYDTSSSANINIDDDYSRFKGLYLSNSKISEVHNDTYDTYVLKVEKEGSTIKSDIAKFISSRIKYDTDAINGDKRYDGTTTVSLSGESLTYVLENKQNKLTPGEGINSDKLTGEDTIAIDDKNLKKLNSLLDSGLGGPTQFIYFDGEKFVATSGNAGHGYREDTRISGAYTSQFAYMEDGKLVPGTTFIASKNDPTNTEGANGDIWFKYSNE